MGLINPSDAAAIRHRCYRRVLLLRLI